MSETRESIKRLRDYTAELERIQDAMPGLSVYPGRMEMWNKDLSGRVGNIRVDRAHLHLANAASAWTLNGGGASARIVTKEFSIAVLHISNLKDVMRGHVWS